MDTQTILDELRARIAALEDPRQKRAKNDVDEMRGALLQREARIGELEEELAVWKSKHDRLVAEGDSMQEVIRRSEQTSQELRSAKSELSHTTGLLGRERAASAKKLLDLETRLAQETKQREIAEARAIVAHAAAAEQLHALVRGALADAAPSLVEAMREACREEA